jgi:hypothetical protein
VYSRTVSMFDRMVVSLGMNGFLILSGDESVLVRQ